MKRQTGYGSIKTNIYDAKSCDVKSNHADILEGKDCYYAVMKDVPMSADPNVQRMKVVEEICVERNIVSAEWLDSGEPIEVKENRFRIKPFLYGESFSVRIAKMCLNK